MPSYRSVGELSGGDDSGLPHSVENYLRQGAPEGGRNHALFAAAAQLRDIGMPLDEAEATLLPRAQSDGLSESESRSTIGSAFRGPKREPAQSASSGMVSGRTSNESSASAAQQKGFDEKAVKDAMRRQNRKTSGNEESVFDKAGKMPLPSPIENGFVELLRAAFAEGERVCVGGTFVNDEGERMPDGGVTLPRETWIERVKERGGDFSKLHTSKHGHYIRLNPMRGGKESRNSNDEVTSFRHLLVEFDMDSDGKTIPKEKQYGAFLSSGLPITAVIDSGNKSLHAWVRVDADNIEEYRERAEIVYELFGEQLDGQNHNPNRYSRAPDGRRTVKGDVVQQQLLQLEIGAAGWEEWVVQREVAEMGEVWGVDDLDEYPIENDPNTVIGNRWMCKGGSFVLVSQSGVGKSTLQMQMSLGWALNREDMTFGIKPIRPLRQLIVQAENDQGDVAEAFRDICDSCEIREEGKAEIKKLVTWRRITSITGAKFLVLLRQLVAMHKPDVCWIDPLINYIGDDISKAEVVSEFCDVGLGSISRDTGCIFGIIHHTGKPKSQQDRDGMHASDLAYMGLGSSNLTNWAREVLVLNRIRTANPTDPAHFTLTATKRRSRAGMKFMPKDGDPIDAEKTTAEIYIRHATGCIFWEQCPEPDKPKRGRKGSKDTEESSDSGGGKVGRPSSLSAEQRREIIRVAAEHGGKIPINVRTQLGERMSKTPRTIANYVKKVEENAALAGITPEEAVESEIESEEQCNQGEQ